MGLAAVDEEHIRQRQELFVAVRRPLEPSRQHLLHGGVVVGVSLQGLDTEPAVSRLQRAYTAIHHHGGHDVAFAGIRDIKGLHPLGWCGQIQQLAQQLQGMGGAFLGGGGPLGFLDGVPLGHGPQLRFLPPLGDVDPPLRQNLG